MVSVITLYLMEFVIMEICPFVYTLNDFHGRLASFFKWFAETC